MIDRASIRHDRVLEGSGLRDAFDSGALRHLQGDKLVFTAGAEKGRSWSMNATVLLFRNIQNAQATTFPQTPRDARVTFPDGKRVKLESGNEGQSVELELLGNFPQVIGVGWGSEGWRVGVLDQHVGRELRAGRAGSLVDSELYIAWGGREVPADLFFYLYKGTDFKPHFQILRDVLVQEDIYSGYRISVA